MLNKRTMVLYCGSAPGIAPTSPAAGGSGMSGGGGGIPNRLPEEAGPLIGRLSWGGNCFPEGRRTLIRAGPHLGLMGPLEGAPRARIGSPSSPAPEQPLARPGALLLPEGELDGCEPDADNDSLLVPSPTPSLPASQEGEPEAMAEDDEGPLRHLGGGDNLRKVTLEVVGRYLREAADQGAKEGAGDGGSGGAGKFLQGLMGRFGTTQGGGECAAQALETLRRVGDGILDKHQLAFQGMLRKMEIKKEDDLKTMSEVASQVFSDGVTNWGRIVTLISFGAFVAKHLKSINQESGINILAEIITDVLVTDKREWLVNHDAWEGFVKFFRVEDIEGSIRNVLMTFAGVAGLGASLAYMIR